MEETRYTLRNIQEKIDYGEVLNKTIDIAAKTRDKEIVADLLKTYGQENNEIMMKIIDYSEKITEKAFDFFEKRHNEYMEGSKFQKIFGFRRWSNIEMDSWHAAIADTKEVLRLASPLENPAFQALIASKLQTETMLASHLSRMLAEDSFKKLNFKGIKGILGQE